METETNIGRVSTQEPSPKSQEDKFKNTTAFIEVAFAEGAHFKVPKRFTKEQWERNLDIVLVYLLNPDKSLEEIGRYDGITRERVRQIKDKVIKNLWLNCSIETQTLFPFEQLELALTQRSNELKSKAKGGKSVAINRGLQAGKSIAEIRKERGLSIQQITTSRYVLRRWGTEVPHIITPHSEIVDLEKQLRNAKTDQEKQKYLNQVKRDFYAHHRKGNDPLFMSTRNLFKKAGFNEGFHSQNSAILLASLKNVGFPTGEIHIENRSKREKEGIRTYHFALAKDEERAKAILLADPSLERFRRS